MFFLAKILLSQHFLLLLQQTFRLAKSSGVLKHLAEVSYIETKYEYTRRSDTAHSRSQHRVEHHSATAWNG
jgi:hypothetical protein